MGGVTRWNKRPKPFANSYHPSGPILSRWRIGAKCGAIVPPLASHDLPARPVEQFQVI